MAQSSKREGADELPLGLLMVGLLLGYYWATTGLLLGCYWGCHWGRDRSLAAEVQGPDGICDPAMVAFQFGFSFNH
ncbi:hypothetical protein CKO42_16560 [Lamprobacter modestohalophilus]|uniref:Uncharacterized protein n=1 Tax=Lamprobacter modestohalophilus TaxID=1064514 RepID=A0A9X1B515_9GAMM|nr:hypothetical protein [Lamprobacter modestohalophilus]MBK1620023.1 hypothetical protein [Lamprobacter modestohalophilus]